MKVFISSLISGFEAFRTAARDAILQLGHEPVMAEDFPSQPNSPQVACLAGLRQSALVILILGERYGTAQRSGISPTHEEYREAKGTRPVIAFVHDGVTREPEQQAFVTEVQGWEGGLFRGGFTTAEQLKALVTRSIHQWELANATGPLDEAELLQRALAQLPGERNSGRMRTGQALLVSLAFGPRQAVLRPAEIEATDFVEGLKQAALFGKHRIFDVAKGTQHRLEADTLSITQGDEYRSLRIAPTGEMLFRLALPTNGGFPIVIEEDVAVALTRALAFAAEAIERMDSTHRLTHLAPAVAFEETDSLVWRSASEHRASPSSYSMGGSGRSDKKAVHLAPPVRPRAALTLDGGHMVEDLIVLLRRMWKES